LEGGEEMTKEMKEEIVRQFGGFNRLRATIGASVSELEDGIQMNFKGSNKANILQVRYDEGRDAYNMKFFKGFKEIDDMRCIYAEDLIPIFEEMTGLYLSF